MVGCFLKSIGRLTCARRGGRSVIGLMALVAHLPAAGFAATQSARLAPEIGPPRFEGPPATAPRTPAAFTWNNVTIDSFGGVGGMLSVVLNPDASPSQPHISYYDASSADLKYATLDASGAWVVDTPLPTPNDEGNSTSILHAGFDGDVHIFDYDQTLSIWNHTWGEIGSWQKETIINLGTPGSFGLDSGSALSHDFVGDVLNVAFSGVLPGSGLKFAVKFLGSWTITDLDVGFDVWDVDLVTEPTNFDESVHVVYNDRTNFDVRYGVRTSGGSWTSEPVATDLACAGCGVSIALDSSFRPHIAYSRALGDGVFAMTHAWKDGGIWNFEDVEASLANAPGYPSLEIDELDNLHLAYQNDDTAELQYAKKVGGSWSIESVTTMMSFFAGDHTALVMNQSCPSIVYKDFTNADLEYASVQGGATLLVPADYSTIEEAVSFACDGDTVVVADGTYGQVETNGKTMTLRSENGPLATTLSTSGRPAIRAFNTWLTSNPQISIDGFSIESDRANGIYGYDGVMENCIAIGNDTPLNELFGLGGGNMTIRDCLIAGNLRSGNVSFEKGGGFHLTGGASVTFERCTIADNRIELDITRSLEQGGGVFVGNSASAAFVQCIIWGNCAGAGAEVYVESGGSVTFTCCAVANSDVEGPGSITYVADNVFTDPLFCGPVGCAAAPSSAGDYTLADSSPALAANSPCGLQMGFLGMGCSTSLWADVTTSPLDSPASDGRGVVWADFDGDDDLDLYVAYSSFFANQLFRNDGAGTFVDVTTAPLGDTNASQGVTVADYDNDGDLDIYLSNVFVSNRLFRNDGGMTFADVTGGAESDPSGDGRSVAWADYDGDGDVDLFIANANANRLMRNDGASGFFDATVGELGDGAITKAVTWVDYDGDGDQDLFFANKTAKNKLFRNDGPAGFTKVSAGTPLEQEGADNTSADWGDYDNDGDLDLYLGNAAGANSLIRNDGGGVFTDVSTTSGPVDDTGNARSLMWLDVDNDGDLDLYLTRNSEDDIVYRNDGGTFVALLDPALAGTGLEHGMAWGDYDDDGDLDVFVSGGLGNSNHLYRNEQSTGNHWIKLNLVGGQPASGTYSNRSAIGARVRVVAGGLSQIREITAGSGIFSQHDLSVHFGLGVATLVDTVEVRWPNGNHVVEIMTNVAVDATITFVEGSVLTAVPEDVSRITGFRDAYPNPFNPSTTFAFQLAARGQVDLDVYNVLGQRVRNLYSGTLNAGDHEVRWRGVDDAGRPLANGIYFVRLRALDTSQVGKVTLTR